MELPSTIGIATICAAFLTYVFFYYHIYYTHKTNISHFAHCILCNRCRQKEEIEPRRERQSLVEFRWIIYYELQSELQRVEPSV